jgi:hypothetical protein
VIDKLGVFNRLPMSIPDVPFIITWGAINVAEGVLILILSLLAIVIATAALRNFAVPYAIFSFFCYVVQLALFATTQVSISSELLTICTASLHP